MKQRGGFTLIEIAIVLVIVGLLIGGILAARSMMNTAVIGAVTRQLGQYDIALENFQDKYNGLPGDSSKFYSSGNNNGKVEDASGTPGQGAYFSGEVANFWPSLETATQIKVSSATPGNFNDIEPAAGNHFNATITGHITNNGTTQNVPQSKIGNSSTGVIVTNDYLVPTDTNSLTNRKLEGAYILANFEAVVNDTTAFSTAMATGGSIKPADALALDSKLDDGKADTGAIIALPEAAGCNSGSDYTVSTDNEVCALVIGYNRLAEAKNAVANGSSNSCGHSCSGHGTQASVPDCSCICNAGWSGADCSTPDACSNSCAFGSQNAAPDCSCIDANPNCANSGGTWDSIAGTCTNCPAGTLGNWIACYCSGGCQNGTQNAAPDCSCTDNTSCQTTFGTWDSTNGTCTCPGSLSWNGDACTCANGCFHGTQAAIPDCSCTCYAGYEGVGCTDCAAGYHGSGGGDCAIDECTNTCQHGTQNAAPDCTCADPGCADSGGTWDSNAGTCGNCPDGTSFDGNSCN